jgi:hypothetical protein
MSETVYANFNPITPSNAKPYYITLGDQLCSMSQESPRAIFKVCSTEIEDIVSKKLAVYMRPG